MPNSELIGVNALRLSDGSIAHALKRGVRETSVEPDEGSRYPRPCPVCRMSMVGEKSSPEQPEPDIHRCLNCGAVVDFTGRSQPPETADE